MEAGFVGLYMTNRDEEDMRGFFLGLGVSMVRVYVEDDIF